MTSPTIELFKKRFTESGGRLFMPTRQDVPTILKTIQNHERARRILIEEPVLRIFPLNTTPFPGASTEILSFGDRKHSTRSAHLERLRDIDMAISTVDGLVAETGSILMVHRNHPGQWHVLLPPAVVFLASPHQLIGDLEALFARLSRELESLEDGYHLITGPSKTADIEKQLVIGMHGPRSVYLLLLSDAPSPERDPTA
ncbi:MAG: hypothetical protein GXO78_13560 [Calditrichaeota bacterium]|nr:hypothetical protein [Calditrichota bacterium]